MAVQRGIEELHRQNPNLLKIEFGIGVNTGTAMAGNVGSRDRTEYSVIGDTVNVASRITAATPAGRIWIGEHTFALVIDDISVRPLNALDVKGREEPVKVFEVEPVQKAEYALGQPIPISTGATGASAQRRPIGNQRPQNHRTGTIPEGLQQLSHGSNMGEVYENELGS